MATSNKIITVSFTAAKVGFPAAVLVRWPETFRWKDVLKAIKAIAQEIHGNPVRWKDLTIFECPFDQHSQVSEWDRIEARETLIMYRDSADGSFVSVGKAA